MSEAYLAGFKEGYEKMSELKLPDKNFIFDMTNLEDAKEYDLGYSFGSNYAKLNGNPMWIRGLKKEDDDILVAISEQFFGKRRAGIKQKSKKQGKKGKVILALVVAGTLISTGILLNSNNKLENRYIPCTSFEQAEALILEFENTPDYDGYAVRLATDANGNPVVQVEKPSVGKTK
ncbi:MAG: hypothetical protein Q4G04_05295 [bacterium]|nr:hypothetical protein [bacterium]